MANSIQAWKSRWCSYICEDQNAVIRHEYSCHDIECFEHDVNTLLGIWEIRRHATVIPEEMFNWRKPVVKEAMKRFHDGFPMVTYRYKVLEEQWASGMVPIQITPKANCFGEKRPEELGMTVRFGPPEPVMKMVALPPDVNTVMVKLWGSIHEFNKVKRMVEYVECMAVPPRIVMRDGTQ